MSLLLLLAVSLLAFANGANDNAKGVATLLGSGRAREGRALGWATACTFLGSVAALFLATELTAKFNGSKLLDPDVYTRLPFLAAVALGSGATVLLASRFGLPVSTTHALAGALVGAGTCAAGIGGVRFAALGAGVLLPLLLSPVAAMGLSMAARPLVGRLARGRDCLCLEEGLVAGEPAGGGGLSASGAGIRWRWSHAATCDRGSRILGGRITDGIHWLSGGALSFARGLNDTPKMAAVLLVAAAAPARANIVLVALAIAAGGILAAGRVARTMSHEITPMAPQEALGVNLVAATLVILASLFALPVSTTHVTSGGLFGLGLLRRREAHWRRVREILLAWIVTLPLGAALAYLCLRLLDSMHAG